MKSTILDSRRKVMITAANAFPGGRDCAAARLGVPLKRLENQIYETAGVKPLSDSEIYQLEQEQGTNHLPDYICAMYGGVFVRLPEEDIDSVDLYGLSVMTSAKRGKVDMLIAAALADGEIDSAEAAEILAVHHKHIARATSR
ncbi:YmfL family putative regulatory protein [Halopseudomonas sp. SMJS2]|uniref:YmfL family putative regulatory protein n=1 Tax=Halopseudomonas sp. SMJS2 TaxID=3041098 RepID=UPI003299C164